ncbi:MAG: diguanylate cyclase [Nitrospiraceae bacterium]|nr:diguanylate cyclase [Nitrospiraceae bacterium]
MSKISERIPWPLLEKLIPNKLFGRLDIASKMLLGYMVLVLLTLIVVAFALISLQRINALNSTIVTVDVPTLEAADKMKEAILAQETYEQRSLILNSTGMRNLFAKRGDEFQQALAGLKSLPKRDHVPLAEITTLHQEYGELFEQEVTLIRKNSREEATLLSNVELKKRAERITDLLKEMSQTAFKAREEKMLRISFIGRSAFYTTALLSALSVIIGIVGSLAITQHIASSIGKLRIATRQIAEGNFDYDPQIRTDDEIGALATAFVDMGKRLRKLEEMYLDASPLTRLPGGIAIENVMKKRIENGQPIASCMFDLDNFKAFNDRYGYAHGSEVIKETARIIEHAVRSQGAPDDFIGHIGGDDFVVITTPDHMRPICEEVIASFDRKIPEFYEEQDKINGYLLGKTRQGVEMKFPIMTISIAIVTNERRTITSPLEAAEIGAELKDYAKTIPKSVFVIDKRRTS